MFRFARDMIVTQGRVSIVKCDYPYNEDNHTLDFLQEFG